MQTIEFERRGRVGWLRLNRPDKLNAMNALLWAELAELGPQLRDDPDLRAVVVTGNGRAFSAGIDLSSFDADGGAGRGADGAAGAGARSGPPAVLTERSVEDRERAIAAVQEGYLWLQEAWYPTIAAVRGYALGAGMQLALACDLRVAARGTKFGMLEATYGLMPDLTGTQLLPRVVGPSKAKELIFTAAQVDADEALRIGLVNQVVDDGALEETVTALATKLAGQPPIAMRWAKQAVDAAGRLPLREGVRFEHRGQAECVTSNDFREAIAAFREGRPPAFTGT
ncbi:MAG TPA: enoyl-CoA hydratase/isomerase family protein [Acidimicrobiales bacterium]|nr:enoyl-CoA hydratase/isomerase family protein [Acidimicrobiales bacterium]